MRKQLLKLVSVIAVSVLVISCFAVVSASAATVQGTVIAYDVADVKLGSDFEVTFKFSGKKIQYIGSFVSYDVQYVELNESKCSAVGGTLALNTNSAGKVRFSIDGDGENTITLKLSFKSKKVGSTRIKIETNDFFGCIDADENEISFTGTGAPVRIIDKTATKSSNANLSNIKIPAGSLTPSFSPDITTYSITIPYSQTTFLITPICADSKANDRVEGSSNMKVGSNQRIIVVTAEDGTVKKYTLNITRLAADGSTPDPDGPDTENPQDEKVSVTADGKDKLLASEFPTEDPFYGYSSDTFTYNEKEFPAMKRGDTVLVYLTDIDGENGAFYRVLENNEFEAFAFIATATNFYEFLKADKIPEGYSEITLNINSFKVTAYQSADPTKKDFVLVYAKGPDGSDSFYTFDTVEQTMQRFDGVFGDVAVTAPEDDAVEGDNFLEKFMSLDTSSKVVCIVIVAILLLIITAIIVLIVKIARPADYDDETDYNDEEEEELKNGEELDEFDFVSISDRDEKDE